MNRGFTFIEMLVVILLMSLITGISMLYFFNSLPAAKFRSAAWELASSLKYAKNLAAVRNEAQSITMDLDARLYSIEKMAPKRIPSDVTVSIRKTLATEESVTSGKYVILYDSTGTSNWEAITLSRGERKLTVKFDPVMTAVINEDKK